jgi:hypothetical protein
VSAAFDILLARMESLDALPRLAEAFAPEAVAPFEYLTPFADVWRKFREADIAADGNIVEQGGERYSSEVEQAINDRDSLEDVFAAMPSGSAAGAIVRILWAVHSQLHDSYKQGKADPASIWEATLFEAMLDLLQPGVLKRIAAGLTPD